MNYKENVIYCKLDNNNTIIGYFICKCLKPKYKATSNNFNVEKDLNTAIQIDGKLYSKLFVGYSQIINGMFYSNEPIQV